MVKKSGKISVYLLLLVVGLILGGIVGSEFIRRLNASRQNNTNNPSGKNSIAMTKIESSQNFNLQENQQNNITYTRKNAIVTATQRVEPCVVGIVVTQVKVVRTPYYGDWFDLFFTPKLMPEFQEVENMGSGFVISDQGLILTNNHVVEGAKELYINFPDGRKFAGRIVGQDPYSDLAVIDVEGEGFRCIQFGNSDELLIGEWVIAIGNPFLNFFNDAQPTVTVGVVSALNRNFTPNENVFYQNMIQTDAAINPGNSGGPLVNALGEVIGINAFIYTGNKNNRGSIGIGFAIPINNAQKVVDELVRYGRRRKVWTGIAANNLTRSVALALGLTTTKGVLIVDIQKNSPGITAGLQVHDIIIGMGNRRIHSSADLEGIFYNYFPEDTIPITVMRNDKKIEVKLILKEYPSG